MKTAQLTLTLAVIGLCASVAHARPEHSTVSQSAINKIPQMAQQFRADTVIFDLDDTLIRPRTMLGSQRWFDLAYARLQRKYKGQDTKAFDAAVKLWDMVHLKASMKPMERGTPRAVRRLQRSGHRVLALTARDEQLISPTLSGLRRMGMPLGLGSGKIDLGRGAYYKDGVIFAGSPGNKLYALNAYQRRMGRARRVMFVDDSAKNVDALVKGLRTPIKGVHYTGAEPAKRRHDDRIARIQLRALRRTGRIPSNLRVRVALGLRALKRRVSRR